ncbi:MAG: hypothetical protein ACXWDO_06105 [Bacteroidia bacterium]
MARSIEPEYIPGTCNIGRHEIHKRNRLAMTGLVVFVIYAVIIYLYSLDREWRLLLFFPAFLTAYGFFQARLQFCATLGIRGLSKMGAEVVSHGDHISKDRKRAIKILIYAFFTAAFATAVVYNFPV